MIINGGAAQTAMFTEENVKTADGVTIFCRVQKKAGPWLVFLHGGGGSLSSWYNQEMFFSGRRYSLLLIDLRGHGNSGKGRTREFFALQNFSRDLAIVLRHFRIKKATIIGNCFGSIVAQQFCADYPDMVKQLVLINSKKDPFRLWWRMTVHLFCMGVRCLPFRGRRGHEDCSKHVGRFDISLVRFLDDISYAGRLTIANAYQMTADFKSPIDGFSKPTLLIHGIRDIIIPYSQTLALHEALPKSRVILLNTNHIAIFNAPEEVNQAIGDFISRKHKNLNQPSVGR